MVRLPSFLASWFDPPAFLCNILVGDEVQSSRIQANTPTAPAGMYRVATPMMPNGHMRPCPVRAARPVSASVPCFCTRISVERVVKIRYS
jgi:hypothetical protein